jgi:hypothetical protein
MSLTEINQRWREHFSGDRCPPVLGLAPVMEDEIDQLTSLLKPGSMACPRGEPRDLVRCLQLYPAATALWLASMSAKAYHDGNFWDNLAAVSGYSVSANQRAELVMTLRRACQTVMSRFTLPPADSSFKYVAELLFQAGLPLCHAGPFAEAVRRFERQVGLPDLADPTGPDWLRDEALRRVNPGLKNPEGMFNGPSWSNRLRSCTELPSCKRICWGLVKPFNASWSVFLVRLASVVNCADQRGLRICALDQMQFHSRSLDPDKMLLCFKGAVSVGWWQEELSEWLPMKRCVLMSK